MKIISASFAVRVAEGEDMQTQERLATLLASIGFDVPVDSIQIPDVDNPDDVIFVDFEPRRVNGKS